MRSRIFIAVLIVLTTAKLNTYAQCAADRICGRWESDTKNLIVEVYRQDNTYKARIVWFNAGDENKMKEWADTNNPDKALRTRKILGLDVLNSLQYEPGSDSYEDGMVYDAMHGHEWNASAYINKQGQLNVKGYWHFKFTGKTMTFIRLEDEADLNKTAQHTPQRGPGRI